jgi:hypothetical protein
MTQEGCYSSVSATRAFARYLVIGSIVSAGLARVNSGGAECASGSSESNPNFAVMHCAGVSQSNGAS